MSRKNIPKKRTKTRKICLSGIRKFTTLLAIYQGGNCRKGCKCWASPDMSCIDFVQFLRSAWCFLRSILPGLAILVQVIHIPVVNLVII